MKKLIFIAVAALVASGSGFIACGVVTHEEGSCEGYTLYGVVTANDQRAILIDMDGNIVKEWSVFAFPAKMIPGGSLIAGRYPRQEPGYEFLLFFGESTELVQLDWNGNVVWQFYSWDDDGTDRKMARQHHDFQIQGNPIGYYAPGQEFIQEGKILILAHYNKIIPRISDKELRDDVIYEVDWNGDLTGFEWHAADHFDEMGFDDRAKEHIYRNPWYIEEAGYGDYLHINSVSFLGENHWWDEGDVRFNPENIIWGARNANIIAIISRETVEIVWRVGPDYSQRTEEGRKLGQIIGQHHTHMIPKGLPGAGNILVFDNGGAAGYPVRWRFYSRVIEFNPVTLDIVWEYEYREGSMFLPLWGPDHMFFSPYISSAQRLPNGNTLIAEGATGRIFEVKPDKTIVWEYVASSISSITNSVYRAYRVPPEWVPGNPSGYAHWGSLYISAITN